MTGKPSAEVWNEAKMDALIFLLYMLGQGQTSQVQRSENGNNTVYNNFLWHV